jgi:hypothetical protein
MVSSLNRLYLKNKSYNRTDKRGAEIIFHFTNDIGKSGLNFYTQFFMLIDALARQHHHKKRVWKNNPGPFLFADFCKMKATSMAASSHLCALNMQGMPQCPQCRFLHCFAQRRVCVDGACNVFQRRAHFYRLAEGRAEF